MVIEENVLFDFSVFDVVDKENFNKILLRKQVELSKFMCQIYPNVDVLKLF